MGEGGGGGERGVGNLKAVHVATGMTCGEIGVHADLISVTSFLSSSVRARRASSSAGKAAASPSSASFFSLAITCKERGRALILKNASPIKSQIWK